MELKTFIEWLKYLAERKKIKINYASKIKAGKELEQKVKL